MKSLWLILSNRLFFAPAWVFASLNIMTGTWVLYLPHVKNKFGLEDAQIGIALFCMAIGLFLAIPFTPTINKKLGLGQSTKVGILLFALCFNLPLWANSYLLLCIGLFFTGIFSGFTDVSMNALVSVIEKQKNISFMSAAHGFFSLGGFIGAGLGSLLILLVSSPVTHMMIISLIIIITNFVMSKHYRHIDEITTADQKQSSNYKLIRPLLGLAIVAFIIMLNEGAVEHWSNLFLFDIVQTTESRAGLGFIAFSLCMTIGRFLGDGLSERLGSMKIIIVGSLVAFTAYLLVILSSLVLSVIGFGILGLGLSVIIPELFRLAGNVKNVPASVGISIVSGIGFLGFLVGPVILGFISSKTNLLWSFGFLAASILTALGLVFLHSIKQPKT
jgi:fucose permease